MFDTSILRSSTQRGYSDTFPTANVGRGDASKKYSQWTIVGITRRFVPKSVVVCIPTQSRRCDVAANLLYRRLM